MVTKAKTLEDIRRVCRPMPLKGEELDVFFIIRDKYAFFFHGRLPNEMFA